MKELARFALIITASVVIFPIARASAKPSVPVDRWLYGAAGYARAVELQRELNVPLVVYFYTDWCSYCRTLDSQYLPSAPVQDYLRGVVKVRINPEQGLAERALAQRYGVNGYPSFFIIRQSAWQPVGVSPFRKAGNMTTTQFANACRAIAPVSRKLSGVRSSANHKLDKQQAEVITNKTTTNGGTQIITVVPLASTRAKGRKSQR